LTRYRADGSVDNSFGANGVVDPAPVLPSFMQFDGRLVTVGGTGLDRLEANGAVDASLDTAGAAAIGWFAGLYAWTVAQQADGKLVVAGTVDLGGAAIALARFNLDGSLDGTLNGVGAYVTPLGLSSRDIAAGLIAQPDGKLVAAATSDVGSAQTISLLRYLPNGTLDTSFGTDGRAMLLAPDSSVTRHASILALQPGGRLIVAGSSYMPTEAEKTSLRIFGFSAEGSLDTAFGSGGEAVIDPGEDYTSAEAVALLALPDGKLLVLSRATGSTQPDKYSVVRLTANGLLDAAFGSNGVWRPGAFARIGAMALQDDGKVVLVGEVGASSSDGEFAIGRYVAGASAAIEFYHAALDHYFLSPSPREVAELDLGVHRGWVRTAQSFHVYGSPEAAPAGFVAACRFYIPPDKGDSHFFSASADECATVAANIATNPDYSGYVYETRAAYFVALPDAAGVCPPTTIAVYRLWNGRSDSNHRYTIDSNIKAQLLAQGYVAEGYGPEAVAMCAALPQ
jgi:uncharacterized delta-60 repeat protein